MTPGFSPDSRRIMGQEVRTLKLNALTLTEVRYSGGQKLPWHSHSTTSASIVLHGQCGESFRQADHQLTPFDITFKPAGAVHRNEYFGETRRLVVEMDSRWLVDHVLDDLLGDSRWLPKRLVTRLAVGLYREFLQRDHLTPLAVEGMALELLAQVIRGGSPSRPDSGEPRLQQVAAYLREHSAVGLDARAVAAVADLPFELMARQFRKEYGCSLSTYARRARVERAIELLTSTDATIGDIARACGFHDDSHLHRAFHRCVGYSPGAVRNSSARRPAASTRRTGRRR